MVEALLAWIAYAKLARSGVWRGEDRSHDAKLDASIDRLMVASRNLDAAGLGGWI